MKKFLRFFRIKDWVHILGLPILGFVYNSKLNINWFHFFLTLILGSFSLAFAYSFNEYFDERIKKPKILLTSIFILLVALAVSSFFSFRVLLLLAIGAIIVIFYSSPPIMLKRIPFVGTLLNCLGFSVLFLLGAFISSDIKFSAIILAALVSLIVFPFQLIHELEHLKEDKREKVGTTATKLGVNKTISLAQFSFFLVSFFAFVLYYFLKFSFIFFFSTVSFSFFSIVVLFFLKNYREVRKVLRYLSIFYGFALLLIFLF